MLSASRDIRLNPFRKSALLDGLVRVSDALGELMIR